MTPVEWAKRFTIPQERWLGTRGTQRWSPHWRPFEGPLSTGSQKIALIIIQGLCQWLTDQHYLHGNPFRSVGKLARTDGKIDVSRALTVAEWTAIKNYLATMSQDDRYFRLRFIFVLAYSTGLRLSELASLKKDDLSSFVREGESDVQWQLSVTGKGSYKREVQLNSFVVAEIKNYFYCRGHAEFEVVSSQAPLIAALPIWDNGSNTEDDALGRSRLYDVIKGFFTEVADAQSSEQRELAERLRRASTHWLRHTFATHALHNGVALEVVRDLLGHRSLSTTSVYVTTERDNRSRQMEEFGKNALL